MDGDTRGTMTFARVAVAVIAAMFLAHETFAQTPRFAVTGGVQIARAAENLVGPGWSVDVAVNASARWAVIGELSGASDTTRDGDLDSGVRLMFYTAAGGARWSPWPAGRLEPFVQLLVGGERLSASARIRGAAIGESATAFMVQPGGGVRIALTRILGWVTQVDYRRVMADEDRESSGHQEARLAVMLRATF